MVSLGDDPRYDTVRSFEALSNVRLLTACNRIMELFGRRYGLSEFETDSHLDGEDIEVWTEARSEAIGLSISVRERFLTPEDQASGLSRGPDGKAVIPADETRPLYRIAFYWNTERVGWEEERNIRAALAEAFECPLVPIPRQYFA